MSSTKKDPSFCVAANDPHLVSLGGGRLSTAVTIHNIPIGDTTVGSSTRCSVSLNGSGVLPLHCTIYRSEENEVTLVPERDARILIDGSKIVEETNLTQGAMITLGKSYYMRFNNPAEAQQIRTAMGSYERVSMAQIDFGSTEPRNSNNSTKGKNVEEINTFYESTIHPAMQVANNNSTKATSAYAKLPPIDINGLNCPKVFTADLVTVNMPAEDVLGQRYTRFAKNKSSDNQRNESNMNNAKQNNHDIVKEKIYDNVPTMQQHNEVRTPSSSKGKTPTDSHRQAAYDRYPKVGNLQIFSMNSVNNEINTKSTQLTVYNCLDRDEKKSNCKLTNDEKDHLDDMLKICTEYTDRQSQNTSNNTSSSPIVQNRIKTNGSLPRERKSPFPQEAQRSFNGSYSNLTTVNCDNDGNHCSSGYENVRVIAAKRVEINSQQTGSAKDNYENVVVGKYVPQSPRTKIRTNCLSPKRDQSFSNIFNQNAEPQPVTQTNSKQMEYDELLKTFGEKLELEMAAIDESSRNQSPTTNAYSASKSSHLNKNKLKLNLKLPSSLQNSPKLNKKPAPAPRTLLKNAAGSLPQLPGTHTSSSLKSENDLQKPSQLQNDLQALQEKIHRLEAQRNATRVMEENQQAKLKQSIEMKLDQVKKLKAMLKEKKENECLKDELKHISESLDNDRKVFEDLEFQYLEEESDWHAYHEELKAEERKLTGRIARQQSEIDLHIGDDKQNEVTTNMSKQRTAAVVDKPYDIREAIGIMSQSLFGSAEMLCPKRHNEDVMSRSVNENMFFNNKIELPSNGTAVATSTPKRLQLQIVAISDEYLNGGGYSPYSISDALQFNLTLGNDGFEVNPLEKRVPSQDDIDRISKVTSDAPISFTEGASTKVFDSIKEIERNRQLLLAQQGHHVIEHERQKMNDLKKKSHSEARAQYLSMLNRDTTTCVINPNNESQKQWHQEHPLVDKENHPTVERAIEGADAIIQQRHSQPELESQHYHQQQQQLEQNNRHSSSSRPLSEANSDISCELLPAKAGLELTELNNVGVKASNIDEQRSSSSNSNDVSRHQPTREQEANERKRVLPKHQRPLTRYLPIFSPDLDLRQHIETAGHQIALCPHVFVDTHSCRGYLHKLGATFHGWSKRWFVLDRQRNALIYYSDKLERKPRGGAYFSTIDEVYLDHLNVSKSGRPHCTFIVKTKKRSYQLQAASDAAARIWIDAIITGAQGNLDY